VRYYQLELEKRLFVQDHRPAQLVGVFVQSPLNETLARLPGPAPELDPALYVALHDPTAVKALEALQTKQSIWLGTGRQLSEVATDLQSLTHQMAEIDVVVSLSKDVGLDEKPIRALAGEAAALSTDADRLERTVALGRSLAEAFGIESVMTVGTVRKLLMGASVASRK
jgi:hypothetical protein